MTNRDCWNGGFAYGDGGSDALGFSGEADGTEHARGVWWLMVGGGVR